MLPGLLPALKHRPSGIDQYTKALLHLDGANGSQAIIDSSLFAKAWIAYNSYQISTAAKKFGTGAGASVTGGDCAYLNSPTADADFTFGTGDFTIDLQFNWNGASLVTGIIFDWRNGADGVSPCLYYNAANDRLQYYVNSVAAISANATLASIGYNAFKHCAVVRFAGVTTLYVQGISRGSFNDGNSYVGLNNRPLIGNDGISASYVAACYIDEFRVSKGVARWRSNFTPPCYPYSR